MAFEELKKIFKDGPLHHAYLISGDVQSATGALLENIRATFKISVKGNPDVFFQQFDGFGIEEARALKVWAERRPAAGERKFFILKANSFTHEAQNALLKTLEEPTSGTHFFILTERGEALLGTVRSRMSRIDLSDAESDAAAQAAAKKFVSASVASRLKEVKLLCDEISKDEKSKEEAVRFLTVLENNLAEKVGSGKAKPSLVYFAEELIRARRHIAARGASVKLILEHIALVVPD